MLTLIIVRHGEASPYSDLGDHGRELTSRGHAQASAAGNVIKGWGFAPSLCLCSDAARAKQTAAHVVEACGLGQGRVVYSAMLYSSYTTQELIDAVASEAAKVDGCDCVIVVGHNPDVTYKADALSRDPLPVAFPTAGVVALLFDVDNWADVSAQSGTIIRSSFL